jgi:hypothetical protein
MLKYKQNFQFEFSFMYQAKHAETFMLCIMQIPYSYKEPYSF